QFGPPSCWWSSPLSARLWDIRRNRWARPRLVLLLRAGLCRRPPHARGARSRWRPVQWNPDERGGVRQGFRLRRRRRALHGGLPSIGLARRIRGDTTRAGSRRGVVPVASRLVAASLACRTRRPKPASAPEMLSAAVRGHRDRDGSDDA